MTLLIDQTCSVGHQISTRGKDRLPVDTDVVLDFEPILSNRQYHFRGIIVMDCHLVPLYNCVLIICGNMLTLGVV